MVKLDQAKLYEKQISLTEWLEDVGFTKTSEMRQEDNDKRERLKVLNDLIGLPFDSPTQFLAADVENMSVEVRDFVSIHGEEACALRLIPLDPSLPKLRMRGLKVKDVLGWYKEQKVEATKYRADFVPHADNYLWSTIFIVNDHGIYGEVIKGLHAQLSQGFYEDDNKPVSFAYDFNNWILEHDDLEIKKHLQELVAKIFVQDLAVQNELQKTLQAEFSHNYIKGYFETTTSKESGVWFIDYNRILGKMFNDYVAHAGNTALKLENLSGKSVCGGIARGTARVIINLENITDLEFKEGEILVCTMTTPFCIPFMKKSAAIITSGGGILSHAAIVSRELKKPCIVGVQDALTKICNGDIVEVNADKGLVSIIAR